MFIWRSRVEREIIGRHHLSSKFNFSTLSSNGPKNADFLELIQLIEGTIGRHYPCCKYDFSTVPTKGTKKISIFGTNSMERGWYHLGTKFDFS